MNFWTKTNSNSPTNTYNNKHYVNSNVLQVSDFEKQNISVSTLKFINNSHSLFDVRLYIDKNLKNTELLNRLKRYGF